MLPVHEVHLEMSSEVEVGMGEVKDVVVVLDMEFDDEEKIREKGVGEVGEVARVKDRVVRNTIWGKNIW